MEENEKIVVDIRNIAPGKGLSIAYNGGVKYQENDEIPGIYIADGGQLKTVVEQYIMVDGLPQLMWELFTPVDTVHYISPIMPTAEVGVGSVWYEGGAVIDQVVNSTFNYSTTVPINADGIDGDFTGVVFATDTTVQNPTHILSLIEPDDNDSESVGTIYMVEGEQVGIRNFISKNVPTAKGIGTNSIWFSGGEMENVVVSEDYYYNSTIVDLEQRLNTEVVFSTDNTDAVINEPTVIVSESAPVDQDTNPIGTIHIEKEL